MFIGLYSFLVPKVNTERNKNKELLRVTILEKNPNSVFAIEANDDSGNQYDIYDAYYFTFFRKILTWKFKTGERYQAEIELYEDKSYNGSIGKARLIEINSFGTIKYL